MCFCLLGSAAELPTGHARQRLLFPGSAAKQRIHSPAYKLATVDSNFHPLQ